jgi:CheY-like chemotaxis protein
MSLFEEIGDKKILLVDDDESIRDSMSMFFLGEGVSIQALETAEEGIRALEKQSYDIIITDYRLPGMDGLSFLGHVRELCPQAYKIFLTAFGSREVQAAAARLDVDEYIEKPFSTRLIRDALKRYKERKRKE